jgi:hypothetical protein
MRAQYESIIQKQNVDHLNIIQRKNLELQKRNLKIQSMKLSNMSQNMATTLKWFAADVVRIMDEGE